MSKVIICIHGRANKPELDVLKMWWNSAIEEGLEENTNTSSNGIDFEMSYYADVHYENRLLTDKDNKEPYKKAKNGAIKSYKKGMIDRIRNLIGDWFDNPLDWADEHSHIFSSLGRSVSKKILKDVGEYYSNYEVRAKIKDRLKDILIKHTDDEIILISHSMGTIIAYDVLRELGQSKQHSMFILEHFITMGSPLGLTVVKGNTINDKNKLRTPSCVRGSWKNFSDPDDFVCLDSHLADDYEPNSFGIHVEDVLVCNDYPENQHKSYGYLRTPEFSKHLASLL